MIFSYQATATSTRMPIAHPRSWKLRLATKTKPAPNLQRSMPSSNATLCGDTADRFLRYRCSSRPIRAAPHPPTPRRRPDHKSLKAEATNCRDPGSVYCPGFFSVAVKTLFCRCAYFAGVCVAAATLLESARLRVATQPGRCRGRLRSVHPASQLKFNSNGSISVPSSASAFELLTRFDTGREGAALVLSQRLCDALLDRFVLRPQRHLITLRVLFDFRTAGRGHLLYCCLDGLVFCFGECWSQKKSARDDGSDCPIHK
jgi:hypothetical protein